MIYKLTYENIGQFDMEIVDSEESSYAEVKDVLRDRPSHLDTFDKHGFVFPNMGGRVIYVDDDRLDVAFGSIAMHPETKIVIKKHFIDRYIKLI